MIFVRHHTTAPRKLANRFSQPIPTNPRQSWQGFDGKQELKDNSEALNYFLDLELNSVNNNYFSFINLRREHFKQFKI